MRWGWIVLGAFITAGLTGCGGGGGSSSSSETCGPEFRTPNYVTDRDPVDNSPNFVLRWPAFPLGIFFKNDETYLDGATTVTASSRFREGAARWAAATANGISFRDSTSASGSDIEITFNRLANRPGNGDVLGLTRVTYFPSSGTIVKAEITMNTWPGMTRAEFVNGLRDTSTHELGHALFLQGHSSNNGDVMYWTSASDDDRALSTRDINSVLTAYCGTFRSRDRRDGTPLGLPGEKPVTIEMHCRLNAPCTPGCTKIH